MGAQVFRHLQIALRGLAGSRVEAMRASLPDGVSGVETDGEIWLLVKSSCEAGLEQMLAAIGKNSISDRGEKIDLASGAVEHISLASSQGLAVSAPLLLRFKRLQGTMIKKVFKEEIA